MARLSDIFHSKYLKAEDLADGRGGYRRVSVQINRVVMEEIGNDRERKAVVYFTAKQKGLVLNRTNADELQTICRSDDTDEWPGNGCVLYVTRTTDPKGRPVPGLRVGPPERPNYNRQPAAPRGEFGGAPPRREEPRREAAPRREEPPAERWHEPQPPAQAFADGFSGDGFEEPPPQDPHTEYDDDIPF